MPDIIYTVFSNRNGQLGAFWSYDSAQRAFDADVESGVHPEDVFLDKWEIKI